MGLWEVRGSAVYGVGAMVDAIEGLAEDLSRARGRDTRVIYGTVGA